MVDWDSLIRRGYLPEVVPPVFSTAALANFVRNRGKQEFIGRKTGATRTRPVDYDAMKRGNQRRTFSMPHPQSFYDISLFIVRNGMI
jgi:hypothetical protein